MKPPLRTKSVGTKVSEAEFAMLEERARLAGLTLSEWVRDVLLAAPAEPGAELAGELVLAEVLALRSLFLNLQFRADKSPRAAERRALTMHDDTGGGCWVCASCEYPLLAAERRRTGLGTEFRV